MKRFNPRPSIFFFLVFLFTFHFSLHTSVAQDIDISNGNVFDGEPYIAVNPTNTQNMVIAWMGFVFNSGTGLTIKVKSSFNGGATWSNAVNMPHLRPTFKSADVSMTFDASGNLFLSYIDYRQSPDSGGVYVCKSTNGGLNWSAPVLAIDGLSDGNKLPIDRPWIAVNNAGDKIFVTSKPPSWVSPPNRPYMAHSENGGANFFPWRYIDTTGFLVGNILAQPMPAPAYSGNNFFVMYPSYLPSQSIYPKYILASSSNNGASFAYYTAIASNICTANGGADSAKLGYKLLTDPSNQNHLGFIFPCGSTDFDIYFIESFDAGVNWTSPVRVNDDAVNNGVMQDMMWGDFDLNGDLVITWRDRRNAAGTGYATASEFYAAFRCHDTANFFQNFHLSDSLVAYNNILSQSGNDFMGVCLRNDTLSAAWGSTRDGSLDIWFTRMKATNGCVSNVSLVSSESQFISVFPNPSDGKSTVRTNSGDAIEKIIVSDMSGKKIMEKKYFSTEANIDLTELPHGIFLLTVFSEGKSFTQKIIH